MSWQTYHMHRVRRSLHLLSTETPWYLGGNGAIARGACLANALFPAENHSEGTRVSWRMRPLRRALVPSCKRNERKVRKDNIPDNKWLIRAESCILCGRVYANNAISPSEAVRFFMISRFIAWTASNIRRVRLSSVTYVASGNGPRNSNSDRAEV